MSEITDAPARFDREAFAAAVRAVISARELTDREAARQAGIASSTVTRVIRQEQWPSAESLAALADWAQLPLDAFMLRSRPLATPLADDVRRTVAAMRASEAAAETLRLMLAGEGSPA